MSDLELIEKWLDYMQHNKGRSDKTIDKYRYHLGRLVTWLETQKSSIFTADAEQLLMFTGKVTTKANILGKSKKPVIAALRGFYSWLHKQGELSLDPAQDIPYPSTGRTLPVPMSLESAEKLMAEPDMDTFIGVRDAAILAIIIGCGLRVSPITMLNESSLTVVNTDGMEYLFIKTREKGDKERIVPVPHETKLFIRAYLNHPELKDIDRTLPNSDMVLFVSTNNTSVPKDEYYGEARRMGRKAINKMMTKYGERAGVDTRELHPHAGRHLFGAELAEDDVDILVRQTLMGHEDVKSTEIYSHLAGRKLFETMLKSSPITKINTPVSGISKAMHKR